jgi:hypothetical protein
MYDNLIPLSWATVTAYGPMMIETSSTDGFYEMWLASGTYQLGVTRVGYSGQQTEIQLSMDWNTPVDFDLTPSGGTIHGFRATGMTFLALVGVSCYVPPSGKGKE